MEYPLYNMIFKRKSFHRFPGKASLSESEIREIENELQNLRPLAPGIKTAFRLVPRNKTSCRRGEYCILIYSEVKEHYLQNAGYMAEQLDLWLASKNIGVCWYGMGKAEEAEYQGLSFVIMLAIGKADEGDFRKDYTKAKRKSLPEIWQGDPWPEAAEAVRYAPSACNTQPWLVKYERRTGCLSLFCVQGKRGMMPKAKAPYYHAIDMGIFMLFLETALAHEQKAFQRTLAPEPSADSSQMLTAVYTLQAE